MLDVCWTFAGSCDHPITVSSARPGSSGGSRLQLRGGAEYPLPLSLSPSLSLFIPFPFPSFSLPFFFFLLPFFKIRTRRILLWHVLIKHWLAGALCNDVVGRATTIEHERSRHNGIGRQQLTVASAATAETTDGCVEISPSADVNNTATRGGKGRSETEAGKCSLCSCAGSNQHYKNARRSPLKTMLTNAMSANYLPRAYG